MQKLSTKTHLLALAIVVAVISLGIGTAGLVGVAKSLQSLQQMFEGRAQSLQAISTINELTTEASFAVSDAILDPSAQKTELVSSTTTARINKIDALMTQYLASASSDDHRKLASQKFAANWVSLRDKGLQPAVKLLGANNLSEAQWVQTQTIDPLSKAVKAQGTELRAMELAVAQSEYDAARAAGRTVEVAVVGIALGGLLVVAVLCLSMSRSLMRELGGEPQLAAEVANRVAAGDLSAEVPVRAGDTHSVLFAMRTMRERLAGMVGDIRSSTETIAEASSNMAAGNLTLSSRTEEHAANIQQTSASMQQLASMVKANAEHAVEARTLAGIASGKASDGDRAAKDAIQRMQALTLHSERVRDITSVIEGISFQTNLLALNAAVEAARAGNQGRGFAVVAQEVRALAERSSKAAKEIGALIKEMTGEMDASGIAVESAGKTIVDLLGAVKGVVELVDAIADASEEQSSGIDQVNAAVVVMDRVTQQNAAFVQEGADAASALKAHAQTLRGAVRAFRL
ncbi:Methyl-accepting chemotaxis protein I serine chemoreceptor protein [Paraburkholderia caribensis MBA4]|uniref:Methyl-accepting chemotaxis protein I serine chemoreceptor protein n=1 Tax=Paraburkholderia caribensis MBA4 TaxID=1323664 RepID=A0A0P0RIV3_9BURK|nr:methyl-accepting chemotaxis protein [Paraburkholderia caribensis]ALL68577.1 Methyl-accepting chemotaxis protein I serine chemoreceptor protein [Paraburkholderia caribensis MBA4]